MQTILMYWQEKLRPTQFRDKKIIYHKIFRKMVYMMNSMGLNQNDPTNQILPYLIADQASTSADNTKDLIKIMMLNPGKFCE